MKKFRYLSAVAAVALLGACAGDYDMAGARNATEQGNTFDRALHQDYSTLAQQEFDKEHWNSVGYYNAKARQAAAGATVLPTGMNERKIPATHVDELSAARAELMRVLDAGGRTKAPVPMSRAQTQFDCWAEQQEENFQYDEIALCRKRFTAALEQASDATFAAAPAVPATQAAAVPKAETPIKSTYTIYFAHDSDTLDVAALKMNRDIVDRIKSTNATSVMVNGYTDRSGDGVYNRRLAERRAATVANALEATGIKPRVGSESFGEDRSAVQTADDVRQWQNRRVVVTVQ